MNPHDVKVVPVCLCSICCFLSVFAVIALPLSFKSLEQGKYALQLSWSTQQIADEVFTDPGVYMVGLGNMLVEFPSTLQSMYFVADDKGIASGDKDPMHPVIRKPPLRARSADGLEMLVSLSLQWQLRPSSLRPLYDILGGGTIEQSLYRDEFVRFARAAIVESCANFAADLFFTNRTGITSDLLDHVRKAFQKPDLGLDVMIPGLQLREVDLPDAFDEEIIKTQEQIEEVNVAYAERAEQRTQQERALILATEKVNQVIQESLGAAARTRITNKAIVEQMIFYQQEQAAANSRVLSQFWKDSDPFDRLFDVMELNAYRSHNESRLLVDI